MSRKNGLILCRNPDYSVRNLPKDVNWIYASSNNYKYDYVANFNCSNDLAIEFLNDPSLYLKPNGTYIHIGGMNDVFRILGIKPNLYYRKDPIVIKRISDYFTALTSIYGFTRWHIPFIGGILSTDVYYYGLKFNMLDELNEDNIYDIIKFIDYKNLLKLCGSSRRLNNLCRNNRFWQLLIDALAREYTSPEQGLIETAQLGNLNILNILIEHGINPAAQNNQALIEAVKSGQLHIVQRLLQDARVDVKTNKNQALIEAIRNGDLEMLKLLLSNGITASLTANFDLLTEAVKGHHEEIIQWLMLDSRFGFTKQELKDLRQLHKYRYADFED